MKMRKFLPLIGIIIFILIAINLDFNSIVEEFKNINPFYSILSFFAFLPIVLMTNIQWQVLLKKHKIKISFISSFKNILIGYFYGFITPGGLGAYTRTLYMQDDTGEPLEKCISNIIIHNTIDYITLLLIGVIGGLLLSTINPIYFIIIIIIFSIELFLLLSLLKKESWSNFLKKLFKSKLFNPFRDRLNNSIDKFFENMPKPRDILLPFFISIIGWIIRFTVLYFLSKLFFMDVPFVYFIFIIAIGDIVASIPITIYGLGTREGILITLFLSFNIIKEKIWSVSLYWFFIIWLFPSLIGGIIVLYESRKKRIYKTDELDIK